MFHVPEFEVLCFVVVVVVLPNIIEQIKYKRKTVNGASFTSIKLVFASTENVTVIISRGCQVCGLFCVCCAPHVFPVTQFFPHVDCLIWFQVCLVFLPNYHVFKSPSPSVSVCWFLCVFPCVPWSLWIIKDSLWILLVLCYRVPENCDSGNLTFKHLLKHIFKGVVHPIIKIWKCTPKHYWERTSILNYIWV